MAYSVKGFLSSPLAVKRDIAVTIFVRCMCVHLCMDFKITWNSCCPRGGEVPFETIFR